MKFILNKKYTPLGNSILESIKNFNTKGTVLVIGNRNSIKLFEIENTTINIKSFQRPNFINKIIYDYIRNSKASRSYTYSTKLLALGISTPEPIAFLERASLLGLKDSYYVSLHIENAFELRDVLKDEFFENRELILRKFVQFTYSMHQKGVLFLDHSPGNTLIKKNENSDFSFYLVDVNRMKFKSALSFKTRMKNFSRISSDSNVISIMSNEYAKLSEMKEATVFEAILKYTTDFQHQFKRKKRIKKFVLWKT